jgi:hypothetical protein
MLEQKSAENNMKKQKKSGVQTPDCSHHAAITSANKTNKKTKLSVPAATIVTDTTPHSLVLSAASAVAHPAHRYLQTYIGYQQMQELNIKLHY